MYPLTDISPFPPLLQLLETTVIFSVSMNYFFWDSAHKWDQTVFVFLCLTYFSLHNVLCFNHTVRMAGFLISFFFKGWIIIFFREESSFSPPIHLLRVTWIAPIPRPLWITLWQYQSTNISLSFSSLGNRPKDAAGSFVADALFSFSSIVHKGYFIYILIHTLFSILMGIN